jgi:hypothetical protein
VSAGRAPGSVAVMEEREPFPTEDPRQTGTSDQNAEENPEPTTPREGGGRDGDAERDAPGTSHDEEGDPGQATGNPDAAG